MNTKRYNDRSKILPFAALAALFTATMANAQSYECKLVQARTVHQYIPLKELEGGPVSVDEVIIEGANFGSNPRIYLGTPQEVAKVLNIGRNNDLDAITLKLPENAGAGTYKLIVQNTTGPFLDNDGKRNPIFCFGSVTVGTVIERFTVTAGASRNGAQR